MEQSNKTLSKYEKGQKTKQHILSCAIELFNEKGFNNVSVAQIIKKANSSKGGFYNHFSSKDDLIVIIAKDLDQLYKEFIEQDLTGDNNLKNIYRLVRQIFIILKTKFGHESTAILYASQIKSPDVYKYLRDDSRYIFTYLIQQFSYGQVKGQITNEYSAKLLAYQLINNIRGCLYDWCLNNGDIDIVELGSANAKIFLNCISVSKKLK